MKASRIFRASFLVAVALGGCQIIGGIDDIELAPGAACESTADCGSAESCLFGACAAECGADADCRSGEECLTTSDGNGCVTTSAASCSGAEACPGGTTCVDGRCRAECTTSVECRADQTCDNGGCSPSAGGTGGTGGTGGSSGGGGGPDASAGAGGAGPDGGGGVPGDGGIPVEPCDPAERPDDVQGIFVAQDGSDSAGGTRQAPFQTIAKGVETAKAAGRNVIYLARGGYIESVVLQDLGDGIEIRGGWTRDTTLWVRDCSPTARGETAITQPATAALGSAAVTLGGVLGTTRLRSLTIETKLVAADGATGTGEGGESMTAVYVDPTATGTLHLVDVTVRSTQAGDGGEGLVMADTAAALCDGVTGCADGADGVDGATGVTPVGGNFTPTGFVPGRGGEASAGTYGVDGFPGIPGGTANCSTCVYTGVNYACVSPLTLIGPEGTCGCGGPSGDTGKPGGGGGASVGVLVASSAVTVGIAESRIEAGPGGDGGAGTPAGAVGVPLDGVAGTDATCSLCGGGAACFNTVQTATGGPPGGTGGPAGISGDGGDGAGGPSHAIVTVGSANVTTIDTQLAVGAAGQSPTGTAASAALRLDQAGCGDGVLAAGEECDDANSVDNDACSNTCVLNCGQDGQFVDPATGTCYQALPALRTAAGARALCRNLGPGWDAMVPSTDENIAHLRTRSLLPGVPLWVGLQSQLDLVVGFSFWTSVNGQPLAPSLTPPTALVPMCAVMGPSGTVSERACSESVGALCERRVDQFQTADCGNGTVDRFEECDDGNVEPDDGCSPECIWDCNVAGTAASISVAERSCYIRLAAPATPDYAGAQTACDALGAGWRMVKLETKEELGTINTTLSVNNTGYWLGASNERVLGDGGLGLGPWRWEDRTSLNTSSVWTELAGAPAGSCMLRTATTVGYAGCALTTGAPVCEFTLP